MFDYPRISKQIFFSYGSLFLSLLFSPLLIFLLTRNLSIAEFGAYALFASTLAVSTVLLDLGLSQFILTKLPGFNDIKKLTVFFSLLFFEVVFLFFILIILMLPNVQIFFLSLLNLSNYSLEFKILLVMIIIAVFIRLFDYYLVANKRIELSSVTTFLYQYGWVFLLAIWLLIFEVLSLKTVLLVWLFGLFISLVLYFIFNIKSFIIFISTKKISFSWIKKGLFFSVPLLAFLAGSWIIELSDRYMLSYFKDVTVVGIYALAYSFAMLVYSLGSTVSSVFYPYIAEAWNQKKDYNLLFNISLKYCLLLVFPSMAGLFVMKEQLISLIAGPDYLPAAPIVSILLFYPLFAVLLNLLYQNMLLRDETRTAGKLYIITAGLNILLNFLLIPKYGVYGAAFSTVFTYFVLFLSSYIICRKHFSLNFSFLMAHKIIIASAIMALLLYFLNPQTAIFKIVSIIIGGVFYFALLLLFKTFVKQEVVLFKQILRKLFIIS